MTDTDRTASHDHPGVERHRLADADWRFVGTGTYLAPVHETGPLAGTMFLRYDQGGQSPNHVHPGGEELYIISGRVLVGGQILEAGDYLYTPPGGAHDVEALTDVLALLILPEGITFPS